MLHKILHTLASEDRGNVWKGDVMIRRNMMRYMIAAVVAAFILLCTSFVSIIHSTRSAMSAMSHDLTKPPAEKNDSTTQIQLEKTTTTSTSQTAKQSQNETSEVGVQVSTSDKQPGATTQVVVNGHEVAVPTSGGSVETQIPSSDGGTTQVQISVDSHSNGTSDTSTTSELDMNTSSTSTKEVVIESSD